MEGRVYLTRERLSNSSSAELTTIIKYCFVSFNFCVLGLSWHVAMENTLFIQRWLCETKVLEMFRNLYGQVIHQSKFNNTCILSLIVFSCKCSLLNSWVLLFSFRYAIRDGNKISIHKNFKERKSFKPDYGAESKFNMLATLRGTNDISLRYCVFILQIFSVVISLVYDLLLGCRFTTGKILN
jgi:hypothetical protein